MRRCAALYLFVVWFSRHDLRGHPVILNVADATGPQVVPDHRIYGEGLSIIREDTIALTDVLHEAQGRLCLERE